MNVDIIAEAHWRPEEVAELAVAAERGGVTGLWFPNMHGRWDAFMALVPAALATRKIRLGVLAISPFETHPVKIANALLSLNEMSGGRARVAIGGGGSVLSAIREDGLEIDYRKLRVVRGVREAVEIVKAAGSGGLARGYRGELFKVTRPARTEWVKAGPAQVFTCSDGPQMTRMGAGVADGIVFGDLTIHRAAEVMENIHAGFARRVQPAEDFRIVNYWAWHIKKDRAHSQWEARRSLVWRTQLVPPFHGLDHIVDEADAALVRDHFESFAKAYWTRSGNIEDVPPALVDYLVDTVCSAGDYGDIDREVARFLALKRAGFTDLALKIFDDSRESLQVICERIVPALA